MGVEKKKKSGILNQTPTKAPELLGQAEVETEERPVDDRAVGFLEVYGLVCAFMAADAGCKAANVTLEPFDKNKPANADSLPVPRRTLWAWPFWRKRMFSRLTPSGG